jgi:antitoxin YefM
MRTINFSDARSRLREVLDNVVDDHDVTIITRRDHEAAVVMSLSDYNAFVDTVHLLGSKANAERLRASIAQHKAGKAKVRSLIDPDVSLRPVSKQSVGKVIARKVAGTRIGAKVKASPPGKEQPLRKKAR